MISTSATSCVPLTKNHGNNQWSVPTIIFFSILYISVIFNEWQSFYWFFQILKVNDKHYDRKYYSLSILFLLSSFFSPLIFLLSSPLLSSSLIFRYTMLVQHLIDKGSNLNHRSIAGMNCLHVACRAGSVKIAFLLLCAGAYVDAVDTVGDTALHWCLKVRNKPNLRELYKYLFKLGLFWFFFVMKFRNITRLTKVKLFLIIFFAPRK